MSPLSPSLCWERLQFYIIQYQVRKISYFLTTNKQSWAKRVVFFYSSYQHGVTGVFRRGGKKCFSVLGSLITQNLILRLTGTLCTTTSSILSLLTSLRFCHNLPFTECWEEEEIHYFVCAWWKEYWNREREASINNWRALKNRWVPLSSWAYDPTELKAIKSFVSLPVAWHCTYYIL